MDAAASPEQAEKLGAVFGGQLGGPVTMLSPLIGEMPGIESTPIDQVDDSRRHSVKVGDLTDIEVEDLVAPGNPAGELKRSTRMFPPANSTLTIATATQSRVEALGLSSSHEGKNGYSGSVSWTA
jgi:hypothetical protein